MAVAATTNPCKLCAPLGACLAFKGVEGAVPFLHGSQGCSTYIRRYLISHFNEPVDIASSSFNESTAIFGGGSNLKLGLTKVIEKYKPGIIGLATTCLAETIGDDIGAILKEFTEERPATDLPKIIGVSTPSYSGTHSDGFRISVLGLVRELAVGGDKSHHVNILPGMVSPVDIRYLKEILSDFRLSAVILPDYSETLDGPNWDRYHHIPPGGTGLTEIRSMGQAALTIDLSSTQWDLPGAGGFLSDRFGICRHAIGMPIGIERTDGLFKLLESVSGTGTPVKYRMERGRLIDSYIDGHKYVSGIRAVVFGEEELVIGLSGFLSEIGIIPALCASGGESGAMSSATAALKDMGTECIMPGADFDDIAAAAEGLQPDIIVGNSKGYHLARHLKIPLIRAGFPIHDRIGSGRLLHLGYRGAQQLFDRITNAIIEKRQAESAVGYSYM